MFSYSWQEIKIFPKYLLTLTLISSIFSRGIFFHRISNQRFIENGEYALIITIHLWLMMWIVSIFRSMARVFYCLTLKLNSQHDWLLAPKHGKDHCRTYWTLAWEGNISKPFWIIYNLSIDHKVEIHSYTSDNLFSWINK